VHAQSGERASRVKAIKVGYITDRLELTSTQATTFWPVYNSYETELREARKAFRQKYKDANVDKNALEAEQYIEDNLDFQAQALELRRKYKERLLKVISPQQLASLYESERDFKKLLIQQLRDRRGRQPR
jgi:Spy/CpxP family protein refolding chaperone